MKLLVYQNDTTLRKFIVENLDKILHMTCFPIDASLRRVQKSVYVWWLHLIPSFHSIVVEGLLGKLLYTSCYNVELSLVVTTMEIPSRK